jgi:uncharacterized protein YegP (UPF0339 family)
VGFEIYREEGEEYRWRFRADDGEIVASGEATAERKTASTPCA